MLCDVLESTIIVTASFQHDDDSLDGGWGQDSLDSKEKDWESWEESSISQTENVFDMMRDGSLSQVSGFVSKYGLEYSLQQRDEYGHTPTHWLALNGHAHVFRSDSCVPPPSSQSFYPRQVPRPEERQR